MIIRKRSKEATATICYIDGYGNKAQRREYFTVRVPSQTMVFNLDTKNLENRPFSIEVSLPYSVISG